MADSFCNWQQLCFNFEVCLYPFHFFTVFIGKEAEQRKFTDSGESNIEPVQIIA